MDFNNPYKVAAFQINLALDEIIQEYKDAFQRVQWADTTPEMRESINKISYDLKAALNLSANLAKD